MPMTGDKVGERPMRNQARKSNVSAGPARPISQVNQALAEFDADVDPLEVELQAVLLRNARILMDAREHRLALNLLRDVLMRSPHHPEALLKMGLSLRELGRYEQALKCFRALAAVKGSGERKREAQILIAETYYLGERDELALAAYRDVLKGAAGAGSIVSPRLLFEIYKNIGNIHVRAGDFDSAEESYHKAYTISPESDVLLVNYGTLEIQRENFEAAVLRFRRAVEINPENDKGWVGLALVHRRMGDRELSWANVQRALDINSRNRTAIRLVVEWAVTDQRFEIAIQRLQEYLEADGEDAEMSFTLAKIFTHIGRLREARLEMERVLALDPTVEGGAAVRAALDRELAKG